MPPTIHIMDFRGTYKGGGGPDKTILNSAAMHDRSKVDVLVTYIRQPNDNEFQIPDQAKSLGINYIDFVDRNKFDWSCLWKLQRLVRKNKITLLHSHDDKTLLYGIFLKFLVPHLRIMYTCHSHADYTKDSFSNSVDYYKFLLRKKMQLWLMRCYSTPVLTISENTRVRLICGGLKPENVVVLYNGIDTRHWSRSQASPVLRQELGLSVEDFLVGTVARITYDKDLPTFFEVAQRVRQKMSNVKFVIVGDGYGDELVQAKNEVEARGLSDVVFFTGHRTDLLDIYASFDLFLMTSVTEGLPNTALEAMAMELPVISTNIGGLPELIVDRKSGFLVPVGDVTALSNAVLMLLRDENLRKQFSAAARKRIEIKFDFSNRVKKMEDLYLQFAFKNRA